MEVSLEEQRFPEAAQTLGKGRGWRRGGARREGRVRGRGARGQPARAVGSSRGTSGVWSQPVRRRGSLAGTLLSCTPPAQAPIVYPSRLHRPRLRVTPVAAAGPGAEPPLREQHHVSRTRTTAARPGCKEPSGCSHPVAARPPSLCRCRRPASVHRCPGPA